MSLFFTIPADKESDSGEKRHVSSSEAVQRDMLPLYLFLIVVLLAIAVVSICQSSRIIKLHRELDSLKDAFSDFSESHGAAAVRETEASLFP